MGGQLFYTDLFQAAYAELALQQGDVDGAVTAANQALEIAGNVGRDIRKRWLSAFLLRQGKAPNSSRQASNRLEPEMPYSKSRENTAVGRLGIGTSSRRRTNSAHARSLYALALEQFRSSQLCGTHRTTALPAGETERVIAPVTLGASLTLLVETAMIRRLDDTEPAYMIKHAMVQDTAQSTLLKNEGKFLHRMVAVALERVNTERLDEYAAELAHHFLLADDEVKTLEYSMRVGDVGRRVFANAEALARYVARH